MKHSFPIKWQKKIDDSFKRNLIDYSDYIDFASNDYLGFSKNAKIKCLFQKHINNLHLSGSAGSRLISGNRKWIEDIEKKIASFHNAENALIFPSAYQANVGLFSCIADRNDLYLIDEHIHASVYDGIRLSFAKHYKFQHNNFEHLQKLIQQHYSKFENIFVVVESLYSMDGDIPDIQQLLSLIDNEKVFLIVDEAHAFGIMGENNLGLFNSKPLAEKCVARIVGYGKAAGFSGAAIVGSNVLKNYLINFCRSFIFSTGLPLYHYQIIEHLYNEIMNHSDTEINQLNANINAYLNEVKDSMLFSHNTSPIQYVLISNMDFKPIQNIILENKFFAKVILPPTVPPNQERIRISLHSFNTKDEIISFIQLIKKITIDQETHP